MALKSKPETLFEDQKQPVLDSIEDKKRAFLEAYSKSMGCITDGCKAAIIHPETYNEWSTDSDFLKELGYIKISINDFVRKCLFKEISGGNMAAIKFYFETDGLNNFSDKTTQATLQIINEDVTPIDKMDKTI